jgi:hypothetical protein
MLYDLNSKDAMRYLGECVKKALYPWHPGKVTMWLDNEDTFKGGWKRKISLEIELFPIVRYPGHIFSYKLNPMAEIIPDIKKMGEEAFKFYRYRPTLPVDEHIILGEE